MKIIMTDGAGFIGSNFVHHVANKYPDYEIINLSLLTHTGNLEDLKPVEDKLNYKFMKGNIVDRRFVSGLPEEERPDVVVDFVTEGHVGRSTTGPRASMGTNVMGTITLPNVCRTYGVKRYYQVSIDEAYDDLPLDRPDPFFIEETPLHTSDPCSSPRASADLLVLAYYRTYGLPVTVSGYSDSYDSYHFSEKLIPLIIGRALAGGEFPVYGTGENMHDWPHVADHCQAIDLVIHKRREGEVYDIGGHSERTDLEAVKAILKALDRPESLIKSVTDRPGHDMRYAIDPAKVETELKWRPVYNFDTGIEQTIWWHLDNQDWRENILSGEYSNYFDKMYGGRLQANTRLAEEGNTPEHVCETCPPRGFPSSAGHYQERR